MFTKAHDKGIINVSKHLSTYRWICNVYLYMKVLQKFIGNGIQRLAILAQKLLKSMHMRVFQKSVEKVLFGFPCLPWKSLKCTSLFSKSCLPARRKALCKVSLFIISATSHNALMHSEHFTCASERISLLLFQEF